MRLSADRSNRKIVQQYLQNDPHKIYLKQKSTEGRRKFKKKTRFNLIILTKNKQNSMHKSNSKKINRQFIQSRII